MAQWIATTPEAAWMARETEFASGTPNLRCTEARHQRWEGFGGCFNELGWIALTALPAARRREVIRELFHPTRGCRFAIGRLPIGASDYAAEWYSHDETDGDFAMEHFSIARDRGYLIPYIKEALAFQPELKLFASPWSPPTWFKFPKAYNYGRMIWQPKYLRAYAQYFLKFVQAYAAEGITIRQVHVQNEPTADQKFPSCLWSGEQMRVFIRDYLGPLFRKEAPGCEVWLGTLNTDDYDGYPALVLGDAKAAQYIAGVGFQWAGKGAVQRTAMSWPDVRLMQTENECGDGTNSWEYARYVFTLLWHYLTNGVNAYAYWNIILQPGGLSTWGWKQNAMITIDPETKTVTYNSEFYVMKHFSHFIEPGAVRLGLEGPWTGNAVAFENPDGSAVVVVANPHAEPRDLVLQRGEQTIAARLDEWSFNTFALC
ncbi:MAG: glycoside hydrolase family 30 protein [Armatimonadota bacterium]